MLEPVNEVPHPLSAHSLSRLDREARKQLHALTTPNPLLSIASLVLQYAAIVGVACLIERTGYYWLYPIAVAFIGARQHSLYMLIHDASHSSLFKSRAANRHVASWGSVVQFFHHPDMWSFVQWKRMHNRHHSDLCTDRDYYWLFRQSMNLTSREITRWEVFKCSVRYMVTSPLSFFTGKKWILHPETKDIVAEVPHWKAFFMLYGDDVEMRNERLITWVVTAAMVVAITLLGGWRLVLMYWFIPAYTMYPFLLELAENTEHHYHVGHEDLVVTATSINPGILTMLFYTDTNRSFHREHHLLAKVRGYNLPALHRLLVKHNLAPEVQHRGLGHAILQKPWLSPKPQPAEQSA